VAAALAEAAATRLSAPASGRPTAPSSPRPTLPTALQAPAQGGERPALHFNRATCLYGSFFLFFTDLVGRGWAVCTHHAWCSLCCMVLQQPGLAAVFVQLKSASPCTGTQVARAFGDELSVLMPANSTCDALALGFLR